MATIANAKNIITLGLPAGQAKVVVGLVRRRLEAGPRAN